MFNSSSIVALAGNSGVASLRVEGYTQALLDLQDYEELVEYHNLFELASVRYPNYYPPGHPNANMYYLKQTPSQTVENGDRIFIHSMRSTFSKKEVLAYLASKGATMVPDMESSNKILINDRNFLEWDRIEKLPTEVDPLIARYSTRILFDTIKNDIRKVRNLSREIQTFDLQVYDNIVQLLESRTKENVKIACILIMSIDWTDNEFYLFFLFSKYSHTIRDAVPSQITGWSDWVNTQNIASIVHYPPIDMMWRFMKKFTITLEQQQTIKKYL